MEYALLVALIAVVCIGAVSFLGVRASGSFDRTRQGIDQRQCPEGYAWYIEEERCEIYPG